MVSYGTDGFSFGIVVRLLDKKALVNQLLLIDEEKKKQYKLFPNELIELGRVKEISIKKAKKESLIELD